MTTKNPRDASPPPKKTDPDDLPIGEGVVLVKTNKGYVVLVVKTQGERILDKEVHSGPDPRAQANEQLKVAVVRYLLYPKN